MLINTSSGNKAIQPGFFYSVQKDVLFWGGRFTPLEIGDYSYQFKLQTQSDTIFSKTISVKVIPSKQTGFLRLNPESDYTFKLDSGLLFRAFDEIACWTDNYEYCFKKAT